MKLLIYFTELLILYFFLRTVLRSLISGKKRPGEKKKDSHSKRAKRFDGTGCDISDGDFKEIR